jgi:hypothetical protein
VLDNRKKITGFIKYRYTDAKLQLFVIKICILFIFRLRNSKLARGYFLSYNHININ